MSTLAGKTLFISGASRGIGLAIALRAARDGANIVVAAKTDTPHPKLPGTIHTAAAEIEAAGGHALPLAVDIRFEDQVYGAVEQAVRHFGGIDILVNNASAISLSGTLQTPMKRFDLMMGVNLRGTFSLFAGLPAAPGEGAQSPHPDPLSAARHARQVVCAVRGVHHGEVRDEHVRAGHGRGVPRRGHRSQCALAAHHHRHGSFANHSRRRARTRPQARNHGRRRLAHLDPRQPRRHGQFFIDDEVLAMTNEHQRRKPGEGFELVRELCLRVFAGCVEGYRIGIAQPSHFIAAPLGMPLVEVVQTEVAA
jgi:hypothetical protein